MDGRGIKDLHKCGEEMSKNSSLPSREQQETSELNGSGGGRGKGIRGPRPFVPVGGSNRDKRPLSPAGPASRWTRDKSQLLSRAQRLPGQMVWNKGLFCNSGGEAHCEGDWQPPWCASGGKRVKHSQHSWSWNSSVAWLVVCRVRRVLGRHQELLRKNHQSPMRSLRWRTTCPHQL